MGGDEGQGGFNSTCKRLVFGRPDDGVNPITLGFGAVQTVVFLFIVGIQLWKKRNAAMGKRVTGNLTMFPAYLGIMWAFGINLILFTIGNVIFSTGPYVSQYSLSEGIYWSVVNWIYHTVVDGILVFLCFRGAGTKSLMNALIISAFVGLVYATGSGLALAAEHWAPGGDLDYGLAVQVATEGLMFLMYLATLVLPKTWLYRRPAAFFYSLSWTVYRIVFVTLLILMYYDIDISFCLFVTLITLVWSAYKPYLVYKTLLRDQEYWIGAAPLEIAPRKRLSAGGIGGIGLGFMGSSRRSRHRRAGPSNRTARDDDVYDDDDDDDDDDEESPLLPLLQGDQLDDATASALSGYMDLVGDVCPMIDVANVRFQTLEKNVAPEDVEKRRLLGAGGTGRVYRGVYGNKEVAIKMLYCIQLEKETIRNFCLENSLLCTIRHPNVVQGEGVCVAPPAIAALMELCSGVYADSVCVCVRERKGGREGEGEGGMECE